MAGYSEREELTFSGIKLNGKDAFDFLTSASAFNDCPACGRNEWFISLTPGEDQVPHLPSTQGRSESPGQIASVFLVWCGNCSFIRLHGISTLAAWKKRREQQNA